MVPCGHLHAVHPRFDLTLRLVLGNAVAFLDAADELVLLAADDGQIVFSQQMCFRAMRQQRGACGRGCRARIPLRRADRLPT